jgi:hypothetical protein
MRRRFRIIGGSPAYRSLPRTSRLSPDPNPIRKIVRSLPKPRPPAVDRWLQPRTAPGAEGARPCWSGAVVLGCVHIALRRPSARPTTDNRPGLFGDWPDRAAGPITRRTRPQRRAMQDPGRARVPAQYMVAACGRQRAVWPWADSEQSSGSDRGRQPARPLAVYRWPERCTAPGAEGARPCPSGAVVPVAPAPRHDVRMEP